ncbi:MAG: tetratricopeptide repeat protein, partial [Alphaproteobacteria bacterium]|nr:tetratricopeptide repeat protein [Alphaproteobacteria bacterium]
MMTKAWTPDSWTQFEARHLPHYEDAGALASAQETLSSHPPLVFAGEARALKADPRNADALANMALAWSRLGNWNKAISVYLDALKLRPDNPVVVFKLGEAYEKMGQLGKAVEQYRWVLGKVPKADHVVVALADVLLKMGKFEEAIRWHQ